MNQPEHIRFVQNVGLSSVAIGRWLPQLSSSWSCHSALSPDAASNCVGVVVVIVKKLGIGGRRCILCFSLMNEYSVKPVMASKEPFCSSSSVVKIIYTWNFSSSEGHENTDFMITYRGVCLATWQVDI